MLRLGALTTVYVNNKNNTAHISKKKKETKKGREEGRKKKLSPPKAEDSEGEACEIWKRCEIGENLRCLQKIKFGG